MALPLIGILALQGDYEAHQKAFGALDATTRLVRLPGELEQINALVLPGGESTTLLKLLDSSGLTQPLQERLDKGLPTFSTCAGLILLSKKVEPEQFSFGLLDVTVARNAWGRQVASFETDETVTGLDKKPLRMVFIRAPRLIEVGPAARVLATTQGEPVLISQGPHLGMSFHPEITPDTRLQALFLKNLS